MQKRFFTTIIKRFFFLALILFVGSLLIDDNDKIPDIPAKAHAADAAPRDGIITHSQSSFRISSKELNRRLEQHYSASNTQFIRNWFHNKKLFTISALGTDLKHHVANAYLLGYAPFITGNMWIPMETVASRLKYIKDNKLFRGHTEIWQTSKQAYYMLRGDCEDHAILLCDWLVAIGYDARVVLGKYKGSGHAWVVLFHKNNTYIIEATSKRNRRRYPLARLMPEYQATLMFNKDYLWYRSKGSLSTDYSESNWIKASRFEEKI